MRPGRGAVRIRWPMGGRQPPAQGSEASWGQGPAMERPWTASTGIRAMGGRKNNHVFGPFFISVDVIAWKSNPWRPLRRGVASVPTNFPRKDGSPSEGPKNGVQGQKTPRAAAGDDDGRRRIDFPDGRFRRKSVCTCVCTFDFGGPERPQCLRAVRLRPVLDSSRMRFYAPYAVALKGKGPKRLQLPKEVHKVHTASLMFAHPYSSLASCSWAESA